MRVPTSASEELNRSMNQQVRLMTMDEKMRHAFVIDMADDERRKKMIKTLKHLYDMNSYFAKKFNDPEYNKFIKIIKTKLNTLMEEELHFEKLDDSLREEIRAYLISSQISLREENNICELKILEENKRGNK